MVDSVQQNFCKKILIPSDFICMFEMSFFFLAHPVFMYFFIFVCGAFADF